MTIRFALAVRALALCAPFSACTPPQPLAPADDALPVDHVILGIDTLARGVDMFVRLTGVRPALGGTHPGRGTANALVALGNGSYLEIMGPDPNAAPAVRDTDLARFHKLTPVAWAFRVQDADSARADFIARGLQPTNVIPGSRKRIDGKILKWRTVSAWKSDRDILPFFIEWADRGQHPSSDAPGGCTLAQVTVFSPAADSVQTLFSTVGIVIPVVADSSEHLALTLDCPTGRVGFP